MSTEGPSSFKKWWNDQKEQLQDSVPLHQDKNLIYCCGVMSLGIGGLLIYQSHSHSKKLGSWWSFRPLAVLGMGTLLCGFSTLHLLEKFPWQQDAIALKVPSHASTEVVKEQTLILNTSKTDSSTDIDLKTAISNGKKKM